MYLGLKSLHLLTVALSASLFVYRGYLMLARSRRLQTRFLRIAPHVIDTFLLASGVGLVLVLGGTPIMQVWLQSKLALIFAYIVVGAIALKYGKTYRVRATALLIALLLLGLIVLTAVRHTPVGITVHQVSLYTSAIKHQGLPLPTHSRNRDPWRPPHKSLFLHAR